MKIMNEMLQISESNPIKARYYDYDHFTYPWHYHSQYELIYVEKSSGLCFAGDKVEKYTDGDLVFLGSGLPHYMLSDDIYMEGHKELRVKGAIIQLEADFMQYSINNYPQLLHVKNFLAESARGFIIKDMKDRDILALLDDIVSDAGFFQIPNILILLQNLALYQGKQYLSSQGFVQPLMSVEGDKRLSKIMDYIQKNYTGVIDLDDIAGRAAMNPSSFCRYFKKQTGRTFVQYVNEMRVGHACRLLMNGKMNITQIAYESGFENVIHFNRIFKQLKSCTPTQYQKNMLE